MCECGCTANDERYLFPAPGNKVYMLTLSKGCIECDAPSGITIERISKTDIHYKHREDYTDGELKFEKWRNSCRSIPVIIATPSLSQGKPAHRL